MIDIKKLKYQVILVTENDEQLNITNAVTDLGWEEGEHELAMRISLTLQNVSFNGADLTELAKPGCFIFVLAGEDSLKEVARGVITEWKPTLSGKKDSFSVTAYDELVYLQKSQDYRYFVEGTGTKTAFAEIFEDWNIEYSYEGPDVPHAKTVFNRDFLSDIFLELLDSAKKQGSGAYLIRAEAGVVKVLPEGNNEEVYHFDSDSNLEVVKDKFSTSRMVTRVKVMGTENADERRPLEAVVDGKTEYGIWQRVYHYTDTDTLATATAAAQEIIDRNGEPERELSVEGPDVPFVRKGDMVHLFAGTAAGYYIVRSIKHDAASCSMSMVVELHS